MRRSSCKICTRSQSTHRKRFGVCAIPLQTMRLQCGTIWKSQKENSTDIGNSFLGFFFHRGGRLRRKLENRCFLAL